MLTIIYIVLFLGAGIFIGAKNWVHETLAKYLDELTMAGIFVLLFVMGISIGINKNIINHLDTLGLTAFIYAVSVIVFSIIFSLLLTGLARRKKS